MKKIFIVLSALLVASAGSAMAQTDSTKTAKDRLSEIEQMNVEIKEHKSARTENDIFEVNAVAHAGYGRHLVDGASFGSKFGPSYEIFINAFELSFNPVPFLSLSAGLDVKWNRFISNTKFFETDGSGQFITVDSPTYYGGPGITNINSRICGFALSVPAMLSINIGDLHIRAGAEASYNLNKYNKVKTAYTIDPTDFTRITKGGEFEKLVISYVATLDYSGLGIYYKYCPKSIIPGSDIIKSYQTIGLYLSM